MFDFRNIKELEKRFQTQEDCLTYYEAIRWAEGVFCPHCEGEKFYNLKKKFQYRCANSECRKTFNVLHRTIFENTKIPLSTWFTAIYLATSHKKGISSHQLARDLGVTQKTAWFILHRIREMLTEKAPVMLRGEVEIDETYIGGKESNKPVHKRQKRNSSPFDTKQTVLGLVERKGKIICIPVQDNKGQSLLPFMVDTVEPRSKIYTDSALVYRNLRNNYKHEFVNHKQEEYVRGAVHTNTIEGFWSLFKRGIIGIYHHTSPKHIHRYCNEFSYRYNTRGLKENERFIHALQQSDRTLLYKELISN